MIDYTKWSYSDLRRAHELIEIFHFQRLSRMRGSPLRIATAQTAIELSKIAADIRMEFARRAAKARVQEAIWA